MRVVGVPADDTGCGYYRIVVPMWMLRTAGVETHIVNAFADIAPLQPDVVVFQRAAHQIVPSVINELKRMGAAVFYELDDNLHAIPRESPAYPAYHGDPKTLPHIENIIRMCDGMIVSTNKMAEYYGGLNPNIHVFPNVIDYGLRDWDTPYRHKDPNRIVVCWSGGSQHQVDVPVIANCMRYVIGEFPHVDFLLYCHPAFGMEILKHANVPSTRVLWMGVRPITDYPYALGAADVAIAPLHDAPFNLYKCLAHWTTVWTPAGATPIGAVRPGDPIWNGERFVRVCSVLHEPPAMTFVVLTEHGQVLSMTPQHRMYTPVGWLTAMQLIRGNRLRICVPPIPEREVSDSDRERCYRLGLLCAYLGTVRKRTPNALGADSEIARWLGIATLRPDSMSRIESRTAHLESIAHLLRPYGIEIVGQASDPEWSDVYILHQVRLGSMFRGWGRSEWIAWLRGVVDGGCYVKSDRQLVIDVLELELLHHLSTALLSIGIRPEVRMASVNRHRHRLKVELLLNRQVATALLESPGEPVQGWSRIRHISVAWEPTVDIQVEGEQFVAGLLLSHNSNLKILEFGARGVPVIASDVHPYREFHERYGSVLLCRTEKDWRRALHRLISSPGLRQQMGEQLRQVVRSQFDASRWSARYLEILRTGFAERGDRR